MRPCRTPPFALAALFMVATAGCVTLDSATDGGTGASAVDGGTTCGAATCTATQFCLYRECSDKERCVPSTSCPPGTTPADCSGKPGCLKATCAPVLQGCRDVPSSCANDVTCACGSVCGSAAACSQVSGRTASCVGASN